MRRVSIAIWTSGEPVSPSWVAYSVMISFLTAVSRGTQYLLDNFVARCLGAGSPRLSVSAAGCTAGSRLPPAKGGALIADLRSSALLNMRVDAVVSNL